MAIVPAAAKEISQNDWPAWIAAGGSILAIGAGFLGIILQKRLAAAPLSAEMQTMSREANEALEADASPPG